MRLHHWRRSDWACLLLMAGGSLVLLVLQWRWTGEVADAELRLLREGFQESRLRMVESMDQHLFEPLDSRFLEREKGVTVAIRSFKEGVISDDDAMIYKRVGLAMPGGSGLDLYLKDLTSGSVISKADWPDTWHEVRTELENKRSGKGSGPYVDASGMITEFPISGKRGGRTGRRSTNGRPGSGKGPRGWLIGEMRSDHVLQKWLPEMIASQFGSRGLQLNIFRLSPRDRPDTVLYANQPSEVMARLGAPDGSLAVRSRWVLDIWRRPGADEAVVNEVRWRNFLVASMLSGLILAAGTFLVNITRKRRELAEEQMRFAATVSHELRTPLTAIRGAAHNLKKRIVTDEASVERYAAMIDNNARDLTELVNQVLTLSKPETEESFAPVSVKDILEDAVRTCQRIIDAENCAVEWCHLPRASDPQVMGNFPALARVFSNLITNAAKHGGSGRWIGVALSCDRQTVTVTISDRGRGIPVAEHAQIFEPFYRGKDAERQQTRGSGLGLHLVAETVKAHRGEITIDSEPGRATAFTITLPAILNPS